MTSDPLFVLSFSPSEHRCVESAKIRNKYPDRVPVSGGGVGEGRGLMVVVVVVVVEGVEVTKQN